MSFQQFQNTFLDRDLQRPNRYRVSLASPNGLNERVNFLCEQVQFPGQNLRTSTDDLRHGPVREFVHGTTYGPITLTFICTTGMPEKQWFEEWQNRTIVRRNGRDNWQARYYKSYVSDLEIYALDRQDRDVYRINVYEAFPKTIAQQEFSYRSNDSYQTLSVEFSYRWWETIALGPPKSTTEKTSIIPELPITPSRKPPALDELFAIAKPWLNPISKDYLPTPAQPVPISVESIVKTTEKVSQQINRAKDLLNKANKIPGLSNKVAKVQGALSTVTTVADKANQIGGNTKLSSAARKIIGGGFSGLG